MTSLRPYVATRVSLGTSPSPLAAKRRQSSPSSGSLFAYGGRQPGRQGRLGTACEGQNAPPEALKVWSRRWDSNPRPTVYETVALPLSYFGPHRTPRRAAEA